VSSHVTIDRLQFALTVTFRHRAQPVRRDRPPDTVNPRQGTAQGQGHGRPQEPV